MHFDVFASKFFVIWYVAVVIWNFQFSVILVRTDFCLKFLWFYLFAVSCTRYTNMNWFDVVEMLTYQIELSHWDWESNVKTCQLALMYYSREAFVTPLKCWHLCFKYGLFFLCSHRSGAYQIDGFRPSVSIVLQIFAFKIML